jgi:hypothetical protein
MAMENELDLYFKKLRKRPMNQLSRAEAAFLITHGGKVAVHTNRPSEEVWKPAIGENLLRFKKECHWSYEELAKQVDLAKKLVIGHVKHGKGMHPETLKKYARAFSDWLGRPISTSELSE